MGLFTSKETHSGHVILDAKSIKTTLHTNGFGTLQVLPDEIFIIIFSYLAWKDVLLLSRLSKSFFLICLDDKIWKKFFDKHLWLSKSIDSSLTRCCWKKQFIDTFTGKEERIEREMKKIDNLQQSLKALADIKYAFMNE